MAEAGLKEVETYISHRQNIVAQCIVARPIVELCLEAKRSPGPRVTTRWWEQEVLYLEGMQMAEQKEGEEDTESTETATGD